MEHFDLTLPDMTCGHCVKVVTATVQGLDPNARVEADLARHRLALDTVVARDVLVRALADQGYPAAT